MRICGDQRGRCPDGDFGHFKWMPPETSFGEAFYVLDGLRRLRERGMR